VAGLSATSSMWLATSSGSLVDSALVAITVTYQSVRQKKATVS
jgi:hypothetical protein